RELCIRHPGLPNLLEQDGAATAAAFAPMDVTVRALVSEGMNELDSVRTFYLLTGFTLSHAAYQVHRVPVLEPPDRLQKERLAEESPSEMERLDLPPAWDFDAAFAFGLSLILKGIEAELPDNAGTIGPAAQGGILATGG